MATRKIQQQFQYCEETYDEKSTNNQETATKEKHYATPGY